MLRYPERLAQAANLDAAWVPDVASLSREF
jgi:hypothetical protein